MLYKAFIVDAFTAVRFAGNQAAKLSDTQYQKLGAEFNLSETAIPIPLDGGSWETAKTFSLRWFTPTVEVNLCGHATLATAHVLLNEIKNKNEEIVFLTLSGELRVKKSDKGLILDFPAFSKTTYFSTKRFKHNNEPEDPLVNEIVEILVPHLSPIQACLYTECKKLLIVLDPETTQDQLLSITHNAEKLLKVHDGSKIRGVVITLFPKDAKKQGFFDSEGKAYDYISRYFAPWAGINEDPATGSSQCALGPFWAKEKNHNGPFYAFQCYPGRGAQFKVSFPTPGRINVEGEVVTILRGEIEL